jgi:outer membrane protein OmpA-like peptidoglycan-associated protein
MRTMKSIKLGSFSLLVILTAACAAPLPPMQSASGPRMPDAGPGREYKVTFPDLGRGKERFIRLTLSKDLTQNCGLVKTQFELDSSEPQLDEKLALKHLSECLAEPSRKDLGLLLVGRTDRHGSSEYNQKLGLRRASRVKQILVDAGLTAGRIAIDSRGEDAAGGVGEPDLSGYDRRVDVMIFGWVHAPN